MPTYTNMRACDIKMFGKSVNSFYPALYGTPAANVAINITKKLQDLITFHTSEVPDYAENVEEDIDGGYLVQLSSGEKIPEERLQESGIDKDINDALQTLRTSVAENAYPAGSLTRTMVDYMINGLERLRRRDLLVNVDENPEAAPLVGTDVAYKTAEYTIVPKLYIHHVQPGAGENGQDIVTDIFPDDFAEDEINYEIIHRMDQTDHATYSLGELQESAGRLNFSNVHDAALSLSESESNMYNMLTGPSEPTAQELAQLKNTVITNLDSLRSEMDRALEVPQNDQVGLRLYGDNPNRMNAILTDDPNGRGYRNNIQDMDNYRHYLTSGLPVLGYFEYQQMLHDLEIAKNTCSDYGNILSNGDGFINLTNQLYDRLKDIPAEPAGVAVWRNDVSSLMNQWLTSWMNLTVDMQFNQERENQVAQARNDKADRQARADDYNAQYEAIPADDQNRAAEKADLLARRNEMRSQVSQLDSTIRNWETAKNRVRESLTTGTIHNIAGNVSRTYMTDLNHLGERTKRERTEYVTAMLDSMMKNMDDMADDLTGFMNDRNRMMSPGLQAVIDKTVRYADRNTLCGPESFVRQLEQIKTEIGKENTAGHHQNDDIKEWADKQITYFNNRILEAKSKGILTDDSLLYQKNLRLRQNGDNLNAALNQFNSRRSSWYRLGWSNHYSREFGVETQEHIMLRVAATRLGEMKGELAAINKEQHPEAWRNKLIDMQRQSLTVARCAREYMKKKNFHRPSGNGGTRYDGAARLYAEAEMMFLDYKTQCAMFDRYRGLGQVAQQYQQDAAARVNRRVALNPQAQPQQVQANPQVQPNPEAPVQPNLQGQGQVNPQDQVQPNQQGQGQANPEPEVINNVGNLHDVIAVNQIVGEVEHGAVAGLEGENIPEQIVHAPEIPVQNIPGEAGPQPAAPEAPKTGSVHIVNFNEMMNDPKISQVKQKEVIRRKSSMEEDVKEKEDVKENAPKGPVLKNQNSI